MEPSSVATEGTPLIEAPTSRVEVIRAFNEAAYIFKLEADIFENRLRVGKTLEPDEEKIRLEYRNFADTRKAVLWGKEGALPENSRLDIHYLRFENPADPKGPGYIMEEGIPIEGLLRSVDRTIERRRALPPEHANLDHYLKIRQILLDNSKSFKDLYFPGKSEMELYGDPAFYARTLYGARQRAGDPLRNIDDITNWREEENHNLRRRREFTLPREIETDYPPKSPSTETSRSNRFQVATGDLPEVITRSGIKIIWKKRETPIAEPTSTPLTPTTETPTPIPTSTTPTATETSRLPITTAPRSTATSQVVIPRAEEVRREPKEEKIAKVVDLVGRTHFARNLRVDPRFLLAILAAAGLVMVLRGGETPRIETYTFGEAGNSLNGLAEAIGTEFSNVDRVAQARERGEFYQPDLAAKVEAQGGQPLPPDDPDFVNEADQARSLPFWNRFKEFLKTSVREHTPGVIDDMLPREVKVDNPRGLWEAAKSQNGG